LPGPRIIDNRKKTCRSDVTDSDSNLGYRSQAVPGKQNRENHPKYIFHFLKLKDEPEAGHTADTGAALKDQKRLIDVKENKPLNFSAANFLRSSLRVVQSP